MFRSLLHQQALADPEIPEPPTEGFSLRRRNMMLAGCACCFLPGVPASAQTPSSPLPPKALAHLEVARRLAADDLQAYWSLSRVILPDPSARQMSLRQLIEQPIPPAGKAFDNLVFAGGKWTSCWALLTSQGILLIDALNNDNEVEQALEKGFRKLSLNPADIKTVIITHGHGDHYGGIGHLRNRYKVEVALSELDWSMMESKLEFDSPEWGRPPIRDRVLRPGETLTLGDTAVQMVPSPGHTLGTLSLLFDVKAGRDTHRALLWGGTSFNFGRQPNRMERIQAYVEATELAKKLVREQNVEVFLSNHSSFDGTIERLASLSARVPTGAPHPFVVGKDYVLRALTVMQECALATQEVWRVA
jgi:metallo-beta-lactamase class B